MIYFDNASTSYPKAPDVPEAVRDALERGCFNISRGGGAMETAEMVYSLREKLAEFFCANSPRNVIFTGGITASVNIALKGILKPGDHVVATMMEHNAVIRPLCQLEKRGVKVDWAHCFEDGTLDPDDFERKLSPSTKLAVMTHASNVCGSIMPIRKAGAICKERGVLFLVDSAQSAGVLPISIKDDNIDILAITAHKGLLGAQGLGGLILTQETALSIEPLIAGGTGSYSHIGQMPKELPDRLEAGTLNLPGIAALGASLDYITRLGVNAIYETEMELLKRFTKGVEGMSGVRVAGPAAFTEKTAIAALDFIGMDNAQVAHRLENEYGIITRSGLQCAPMAHKALNTFPRGVVRLSFGHKNTADEVDTLLNALENIRTP